MPLPGARAAAQQAIKAASSSQAASGSTAEVDEDAVLRTRFLSLTSSSRGVPIMDRLAKRFFTFATAVERSDEDAAKELYTQLVKDCAAVAFQLEQMEAKAEVLEKESDATGDVRSTLARRAEATQAEIESLKSELSRARRKRRRLEEYEGVRRLIVKEPPRSHTSQELSKLAEEVKALQDEHASLLRKKEIRRKQFSLLLTTIENLTTDIGHDDHDDTTNLDDNEHDKDGKRV